MKTQGTASQQEELRGDGGAKGGPLGAFSLSFSLSRESESCFNFVIIAVFLKFVSVLEKGWRPKVLTINVSKLTMSLYNAEEHK